MTEPGATHESIERWLASHGPDRICEILEPMLTPERIARIDSVLAARLSSVITVVEDTYDPHNAAATIRTTESLGLPELHVIEPNSQPFQAAKGITRGAHDWIAVERWTAAKACIEHLQGRGYKVYATLPGATHSIEDVDVTTPIAVAFGNEHEGLTQAAIDACDGSLGVPMYGFTESFNLSVTVALAMSRVAQRRRAAIGALGDLTDEKRRTLRAKWFAQKIRHVTGILERALG